MTEPLLLLSKKFLHLIHGLTIGARVRAACRAQSTCRPDQAVLRLILPQVAEDGSRPGIILAQSFEEV